jgi:peptidoglycan/LPS O-acetylase OafA/YrhL
VPATETLARLQRLVGAIGGACFGLFVAFVTGVMTRNPLGAVGVPLGAAIGVVLGLMKKPDRLSL